MQSKTFIDWLDHLNKDRTKYKKFAWECKYHYLKFFEGSTIISIWDTPSDYKPIGAYLMMWCKLCNKAAKQCMCYEKKDN